MLTLRGSDSSSHARNLEIVVTIVDSAIKLLLEKVIR